MSPNLPRSLAIVFLMFGGCEDDPAAFTDAGPVDGGGPDSGGASVDANPDANAVHGPITVHVSRVDGTGAPDTGAVVYFADADGTFLGMSTPDSAGVAVGNVAAGGSVTVKFSGTNHDVYRTVLGVAIGDELYFGEPATRGAGTMTVTVPAAAGAIRYRVSGPCASSIEAAPTTISVTLAPGCPATRPLVATAVRGAMPDQFMVVENATPTDGATLAMTGPWLDAVPGATVALTGVPAGATSETVSSIMFAEGYPVHGLLGTITPGTPPTAALPRAPGTYGGRSVTYRYANATWAYHRTTYASPIPGSPATLAVAPTIAGVKAQQAANTITLTEVIPGDADGFRIATEQLGEKDELLAEWLFIAPPTATSVTRPDLPSAPVTGLTSMSATEIDIVAGYAALRPFAGMDTWFGVGPTPVAAHTRQTSFVY